MKNKTLTTKFYSSQAGVSLLSVLIAVGILGVIGASMSKILSSSFQANKSFQYRNDIEQIRLEVMDKIDCNKTFDGVNLSTSCNANGFSSSPFPILKSDGSVFLHQVNGRSFGNWTVKPFCKSNELQIRASLKINGNFVKDPLSKKIWDGSNDKSNIFKTGFKLCEEVLNPTGTVPTPTGTASPVSFQSYAIDSNCHDSEVDSKQVVANGHSICTLTKIDIRTEGATPGGGGNCSIAISGTNFTLRAVCDARYTNTSGEVECEMACWNL